MAVTLLNNVGIEGIVKLAGKKTTKNLSRSSEKKIICNVILYDYLRLRPLKIIMNFSGLRVEPSIYWLLTNVVLLFEYAISEMRFLGGTHFTSKAFNKYIYKRCFYSAVIVNAVFSGKHTKFSDADDSELPC